MAEFSEVQPGSYLFMDTDYGANEDTAEKGFSQSLYVHTTVRTGGWGRNKKTGVPSDLGSEPGASVDVETLWRILLMMCQSGTPAPARTARS